MDDLQKQFQEELLAASADALWPDAQPELETLNSYLTQPGWLIARSPAHPYHRMLLTCLQRLSQRFSDPGQLGELAADAYFRSVSHSAETSVLPNLDENTTRLLQQISSIQNSSSIQNISSYIQVLRQALANQNTRFLKNAGEYARLLHELPFIQNLEAIRESVHLLRQEFTPRRSFQGLRALRILNACLVQTPVDVVGHIRSFLKPFQESSRGRFSVKERVQDCFNLLIGLPDSPQLLDLLVELRPSNPWAPGSDWTYRAYDAAEPLRGLLRTLYAYDLWTYEAFRRIALLLPYRFMAEEFWQDETNLAFRRRIASYQEQLVSEVAQDLSAKNFPVIYTFKRPLLGARWLLAAACAHSRLHLGELVGTGGDHSPETLEQAVIRLARAQESEPADEHERAELARSLRNFPETTLKSLFAVAVHARRVLCLALGWEKVLPLVDLVENLASLSFDEGSTDIPNSVSPLSGVVDVAAVRGVLANVEDELAEEVLGLLARGKAGVENAATLVRAVGGWNRASVLKGLKRSGQVSIKAYGLLPLTRGEDEVVERYLELQRQAQLGQKFGPSRRATHAAAVEAAIANLAQTGGYRDAAHLKWEMEARIVQQSAGAGTIWTIGSYQIQIALEGAQAAVQVSRAGRVLKSIPQEVRASEVYKGEVKESLTRLRAHVSRIKKGLLERLLETGESLNIDEFSRLLAMPTARALLSRLIWIDAEGTTGLLDPEAVTLSGPDGMLREPVAPLAVAHPYHLLQAGTLSQWQRAIVHRRIVQPIKQAFRELYVLTPAEQQTVTYSQRFAGHHLNGAVALRLLASRNWRIRWRHSDDPVVYKTVSGIRAVFELSHSGHYLSEPGSEAITGLLFFEHAQSSFFEPGRVPLAEVPPLIFSEVMRDADLVVSVAQTAQGPGQGYSSPEMYAHTTEVVKALLDELQLSRVTIDGHFAYVQGKLARYRVHLASAAIHIEPGNYLCIVPATWGQTHEQLFLPFVDENAKISEVISKILLLLEDDKIKDESILRQIRTRS